MLYLIWEIGEVARSSGQIGDCQLFKLHETTNHPDQSNEPTADTGTDFNQHFFPWLPSPQDMSGSLSYRCFSFFVKQNISGFIRKYNPAYSAMKICGVKIYASLIHNDEILNSTKYSLHFLGHSKLCKAPVCSNSPNLSLNEQG